jgi:hypothetical protein
MRQALYPPTGPQPIGQVLDRAFRIFQAALARCLPHGMLSMIAGQLPNIYQLAMGRSMQPLGGGDPVWWILYAIGTALALVLWSAMLLRQRSTVDGQPVNALTELKEALRRIPALIGLLLLIALMVAGGVILLILPGIYLATASSLAWPALMVERRSPLDAVRQSLRLVKGNWWRVSAVIAVALIVALVFYIVVFATLAIVLPLAGANDVAMFTAASVVVLIALGAIGMPFYGAVLLSLHDDLRLRQPVALG